MPGLAEAVGASPAWAEVEVGMAWDRETGLVEEPEAET